MKKIPTVFRRDPDNMARVLPEVHPDCGWVLAGEGIATRKYDGTCVMLDDRGDWWARREVKKGKQPPANFQEVEHDPVTGKSVGWEPIGQSAFAKWHTEALGYHTPVTPGTYELCGPKINGNPEQYDRHTLIWHAGADAVHALGIPRGWPTATAAYEHLRGLLPTLGIEGVVWHHADGRMAKLKSRDFR